MEQKDFWEYWHYVHCKTKNEIKKLLTIESIRKSVNNKIYFLHAEMWKFDNCRMTNLLS